MTVYVGSGQPVFEFILPDECIEEANTVIDDWLKLDKPSPEASNVVARQTDWDMKMPKCESYVNLCCKMIANLIYNAGGRVYGGLNDGTTDVEYFAKDIWGADYKQGDYVKPHCHFPADFAAVGYLKIDDGASPIIFYGRNPYYVSARQLLILDAKMQHEVPVTSAGRRCFAMNLYKKAGTF